VQTQYSLPAENSAGPSVQQTRKPSGCSTPELSASDVQTQYSIPAENSAGPSVQQTRKPSGCSTLELSASDVGE
ncbi:unnamed protein product, partial [Strongylus vulgaris]